MNGHPAIGSNATDDHATAGTAGRRRTQEGAVVIGTGATDEHALAGTTTVPGSRRAQERAAGGAGTVRPEASHANGASPVADLRIVADGDFGTSVAGHLRTLVAAAGGRARVAHDPVPGFAAGGRFGVRASWRDLPAEFAAFGRAAHPVPWLPIAPAPPYIRVGPVFVPGRPPCHTCYLARLRQHESPADEEIRLRLAADPHLGVRGFPPHQAMMAAGLALALLTGGDRGTVAVIDCRTDEVTRWRVVPADRCPGCGDGAHG
ncbi:TOMM precursor leader peptide-binding protein [Sphaerisporangium melleum]|uniref:TOMM leader peptide-binding protein n=1 Tax=Sphaerisporangium melleum TaxID=321316 RepID=A0A917VPB1_9ACTN|nr:TOMM precursor leader peptide-binding protein [Sphaerisporangium melleum]GGL05253.1 hypothetical protein GCM10007964_54290 [Sphaerisporangium melleum]